MKLPKNSAGGDTARSRSHQQLGQLLSQAVVAEALGEASTLFERRIVRCIVLQNVLSGRIAGLMRVESVANQSAAVAKWLIRYIQRVFECYQSQSPLWSELMKPDHNAEFYDLLQEAARTQLQSLRTRYPSTVFDRDDMVNEAFVHLHSERHLLSFPFDVPLQRWLGTRVLRCTLQLYRLGRFRSVDTAFDEETFDESEGASRYVAAADQEYDLDLITLLNAAATFPHADQVILNHLRLGIAPDRTAKVLGIAAKTVYKHRLRVIARLRDTVGVDAQSQA